MNIVWKAGLWNSEAPDYEKEELFVDKSIALEWLDVKMRKELEPNTDFVLLFSELEEKGYAEIPRYEIVLEKVKVNIQKKAVAPDLISIAKRIHQIQFHDMTQHCAELVQLKKKVSTAEFIDNGIDLPIVLSFLNDCEAKQTRDATDIVRMVYFHSVPLQLQKFVDGTKRYNFSCEFDMSKEQREACYNLHIHIECHQTRKLLRIECLKRKAANDICLD